MTKHPQDEALFRGHVDLEETKINTSITDLMEKNTLSICATQIKPLPKAKRAIIVKAGMRQAKSRLGRIMHKLYDLEPSSEADKQLNVNLDVDLYQMENW